MVWPIWVVLLGVSELIIFGMMLANTCRNFLNKAIQFCAFRQDDKFPSTRNVVQPGPCAERGQRVMCSRCGRSLS